MTPKTFSVDNSAILYLALMRKKHTNIYRFTMTMKQAVDPALLQQAMDRIYRRFPTIIAGFRPGLFQYTVVPAAKAPLVRPDPGLLIPMSKREIRECAYRIFYRGREISLEAFHANADGFGAVASFTTLVAEYLRLRHALCIPVCNTLREVDEVPPEHELEDAYLVHCQARPLHLPSRYSYQLPGAYTEPNVYPTTRTYSTDTILAAARKLGVSMTSMLSGILASAVMEVQQRHRQKLQPVRIMIPADLRRMFGSSTLRNFILYALPTMEPGEEKLPLRELLARFHSQIKEQLTPEKMLARVAYNVRTQNAAWYRFIPLELKRLVMRICYKYFGESNSSITLTNIGNVTLPEEMSPHVEGMRVTLTPRAGSPYNCAIIGLHGRLAITFSRFCPRQELESVFFTKLDEVLAAV